MAGRVWLGAAALVATLGLTSAAGAQDAVGDWRGAVAAQPGLDLRVAVHLRAAAGGGLAGAMDSPDRGAYDEPLEAISATGGKLAFTDSVTRGAFAGTWDSAGHAWKGVWTQGERQWPLTLVAGDLPPAPVVEGLDGEWDGSLNLGTGLVLRLAFHIHTGPHGTLATLDSVDQGAYGAPVQGLSRQGDDVRIDMTQIKATFEGHLTDNDQTLAGVFTQGGMPLPLTLKRLAPGQPSPWPKPAGPPPSAPHANWQTPSDAEIRQLLVERVDKQRQGVGIVVGVVDASGRRIVSYGTSGAPNGRLDGDTEFEIGSITKVFTALVLADMARTGELTLDDPIAKYLPAGVTAPSKDGKQITLAELTTHTSGLPRLPTNMSPKDPANPYADYTMDQLWRFLSTYQLPRDPGASWAYSNLGFGLLGDLLARRAGTDYQTLVKRRVLSPLGMASTTITLTPDERARLAQGHDSQLRPVENWDLPTLAGAGALRSTANDLMTFLAAEMGLTPSPLAADMAETLAVRRPSSAPAMDQALGWEVLRLPGGDIVEHGGGTGGYHTFVAFDAKRKVGVVVLTNAETIAGGDDIALHILAGAPVVNLPPPPPPAPDRHAVSLDARALDALTGVYELAPQVTLTISREGQRLMAQLTGQPAYEVFPESPTAVFWKVVDAQATFQLGADGKAASLTLHQSGRDIPAKRVK